MTNAPSEMMSLQDIRDKISVAVLDPTFKTGALARLDDAINGTKLADCPHAVGSVDAKVWLAGHDWIANFMAIVEAEES